MSNLGEYLDLVLAVIHKAREDQTSSNPKLRACANHFLSLDGEVWKYVDMFAEAERDYGPERWWRNGIQNTIERRMYNEG